MRLPMVVMKMLLHVDDFKITAYVIQICPLDVTVYAACRLFSRGVIFTCARVSLALLSLRKNGGLLVVYNKLSWSKVLLISCNLIGQLCLSEPSYSSQTVK